MSLLKLFSFQVVLITLHGGCRCENDSVRMDLSEVQVTNNLDTSRNAVFYRQALIKISQDRDEYAFEGDELARICGQGQTFTSDNIEVRSVFKRTLSFSLITADKILTIFCQFVTNRDLQFFFSQLRKPYILEEPVSVNIRKMIHFTSSGEGVPIAENSVFYRNRISKPKKVHATDSYNLVRLYSKRNEATGSIIQTQEADLVFISRTFNVTDVIGNDKVGVCLLGIPPGSLILLRFADHSQASAFVGAVRNDANPIISCSVSDDWLAQRAQYIDTSRPFNLPHPYLESNN